MAANRIVIVGGGIGGLGLALSLLDSGRAVPADLRIIEGSPGSGRLHTQVGRNAAVCEMGAGRYHPRLHPLLEGLLARFAMPVRHSNHRVVYQLPPDEVAGLTARVDLAALRRIGSFHGALSDQVGTVDADRLCSLTGYEALRDSRFPAAGGVELIKTHPEAFASEPYRGGWVAPRGGFSELARSVRSYLAGRGVGFMQPARLVFVHQRKSGLTLEVLDEWRRRSTVDADELVLTMLPNDIFDLGLPLNACNLDWRDHLVSVPLFKGYLIFETAWWDAIGLEQTCVVSDNQLQKLYFDSPTGTIHFYCDSWNSGFWNTLRASGDSAFRTTLFAKIGEAVGQTLPRLTSARDLVSHYWATGIAFMSHTWPEEPDGYVRLANHILLSAGAFTKSPGWIEGVLETAQALPDILESALLTSHR